MSELTDSLRAWAYYYSSCKITEEDLNEAADLIEQQHKRITELEAQLPKWVSVDKDLPEANQEVLISWVGEKDIFEATFVPSKDGKFWSFEDEGESFYPTHWMLIPQPSKEKRV